MKFHSKRNGPKPYRFFSKVIERSAAFSPSKALAASFVLFGAAPFVQVFAQVSPPPDARPASVSAPSPDRTAREQALVKIFEGQRHLWKAQRLRSQAARANSLLLARASFEKAAELDPTLAEPYAVLAELAVTIPPGSLDEGIRLASEAVRRDPDNFGGRRLLARLFTIKSGLHTRRLDPAQAAMAIQAWQAVGRLDQRNAEAWAMLSAFAEAKGNLPEQITYLRKWVSAASPTDVQFYGRIMGGGASLQPEAATLRLASALMKSGAKEEAVKILAEAIADDPENSDAASMLSELVDSADLQTARLAVDALQQAVFANSDNVALIASLARLRERLGQTNDAVAVLKRHITLLSADARAASALQVSLAELYLRQDRHREALSAFERALSVRGLTTPRPLSEEEREFVRYVFEKMIQASKNAGRPETVRTLADRARKLLGRDDLFADQ